MSDWNDLKDYKSLINKANLKFKLKDIFKEKKISFNTTFHAKGWTHKRPCPFHNDSNPSFFFNPEENRFHCFGCGKSGQTVQFLAYLEGKSQKTVAETLLNSVADGYVPDVIIYDGSLNYSDFAKSLYIFANYFNEWKQKHPDLEIYANNMMWIFECYLKNNIYHNHISNQELESRIQFCYQKLQEFECLKKL